MALKEETGAGLESFSTRALDAEARLDRLEVELHRLSDGATSPAETTGVDTTIKSLYLVREQLEAALVEQIEAKLSEQRLRSENEKLKYRIKHLLSALREADGNSASCSEKP